MAILGGSFELGLSTGRSGSGLCPTRNWPDNFGSPKYGPAADPLTATVRLVGRRSFPVGFRSGSDCENRAGFLPKFAYFCWIWPDFNESLADLNELRPISKRSGEISTRSGPISKRSGEISKRSGPISKRSGQISTRSRRISSDRTKSYRRTTSIDGESFSGVFSGQVGWNRFSML